MSNVVIQLKCHCIDTVKTLDWYLTLNYTEMSCYTTDMSLCRHCIKDMRFIASYYSLNLMTVVYNQYPN